MKKQKIFFPIILLLLALISGCVDNEPKIEDFPNENLSFKYSVNGDYTLDYLVGSTIQFNNVSELKGSVSWDFGDKSAEAVGDNPTHIYTVAGTYYVKMTMAGQGSVTKKLLVSDIFPTITLAEIPGGICEVKNTSIELNVGLPNPQNLVVEYKWIFPEGTLDQAGNPILTSTSANPGKIRFSNVGSQKVRLLTKLDGRSLEEGVVNVPVAYSQEVKTLYYAVKGGNLMALKLVNNAPADVKIYPFDLGVKSGQHSFNLLFDESSLYVLDAGKQFTYVDDVDMNLGDGRITVVSKDGSVVETMLTNNGGYAFNDPFFGYIDNATKTLYFSNRNTGISTIGLNARNETMDAGKEISDRKKYPYWVQNQTLGYYGNPMTFGAITANFMKVGDVWWMSKTYNGDGIFTFKATDILKSPITVGGVRPNPYGNTDADGLAGQMLPAMFIKSFVVDEKNKFVYFVVYNAADAGFYKVPMSEMNTIKSFADLRVPGRKIVDLVQDSEGSAGEYVSVSQMVLDSEDGSVYFGYRSGDVVKMKSGLKRYNPATNKVEGVIDNVEIYGVTINNTKSKLF